MYHISCIISYHVISYHITYYISYHVSYHILYHIYHVIYHISFHIIYRISYRIISYHHILYYIILYYIILYCIILYYIIIGPPSYMRSVVDRNVIMQRIPCLFLSVPLLSAVLLRFSLSSIRTFPFALSCPLFLIVFCLDSRFLTFHLPLLYFYHSSPLCATFILFPFSLNYLTVFHLTSPSTRIVQRRWTWTLYLEFWDQLHITPSH